MLVFFGIREGCAYCVLVMERASEVGQGTREGERSSSAYVLCLPRLLSGAHVATHFASSLRQT